MSTDFDTTHKFDDPIAWFAAWFADAKAAGIKEFNACCVATVGANGQPSARIVLLKEFDQEGFVFYTNLESKKGVEALEHDRVALTFYWRELDRQIRIEGRVSRVDDTRADAYFATRERGSQVGAWASEQSRPLDARRALVERVERFDAEFAGVEVPRPPHWSGLLVEPTLIEFWSSGDHRLHDRFEFSREGASSEWSCVRLSP